MVPITESWRAGNSVPWHWLQWRFCVFIFVWGRFMTYSLHTMMRCYITKWQINTSRKCIFRVVVAVFSFAFLLIFSFLNHLSKNFMHLLIISAQIRQFALTCNPAWLLSLSLYFLSCALRARFHNKYNIAFLEPC